MRGYPYHILGTSERDDSLSYLIDCLLRSRIETGEETSDDEDVNVYLSTLLHSFLDRTFYVKYGEFLSFYNIDVFQWAEGSADLRTKYQVYKGNADFALVTTGIFEEPISRARQTLLPFRERPHNASFEEKNGGRGSAGKTFGPLRNLPENPLSLARDLPALDETPLEGRTVPPRARGPAGRAFRSDSGGAG